MPPKDMLDESEYSCPNCRESETYVDKRNDMFLCSECEYEEPIEHVEQLQE